MKAASPGVTECERGMSLAEMLVSLALLAIILLTGTTLLIEMMHSANREEGRGSRLGGDTDNALDIIERDLRDAVTLPPRAGPLHRGSRVLVVELATGEVVVYEASGPDLLRWTATGETPVTWTSRRLLTPLTLADFHRVSTHVTRIALRRRGEPLRQRDVLLRNVAHGVGHP